MGMFPFWHYDEKVFARGELKFEANGLFVTVLGIDPLIFFIV
jgi:hypothetical protein